MTTQPADGEEPLIYLPGKTLDGDNKHMRMEDFVPQTTQPAVPEELPETIKEAVAHLIASVTMGLATASIYFSRDRLTAAIQAMRTADRTAAESAGFGRGVEASAAALHDSLCGIKSHTPAECNSMSVGVVLALLPADGEIQRPHGAEKKETTK
jgi:hypothetical protein